MLGRNSMAGDVKTHGSMQQPVTPSFTWGQNNKSKRKEDCDQQNRRKERGLKHHWLDCYCEEHEGHSANRSERVQPLMAST